MRKISTNTLGSNALIEMADLEGSCVSVAAILKELSHPQRLLVLGHLLGGAKTVSELVDLCGISQSQMSHFLMRMRFSGLVEAQKKGKFQYYNLADKRLVKLIKVIRSEYCVAEK